MSTTPQPPLGTDGHPSLDTLAELDEQLLAADADRLVRDHVEGCPDCQRARVALAAVPGDLARLADAEGSAGGRVAPVPEDVAARLDTTLADELRRPVGGTAATTITPLSSAGGGRRGRAGGRRDNRILQAAAAAVLVLAAVGVGASALSSHGGSGSSDTKAASDSAGGRNSDAKTLSSTFAVLGTGTNYTAESLPAAIPGLLATSGTGVRDSAAPEGSPATDDPERLATGPALAGCVAALAGEPATPLVVDIARFQGKPASVIVLPTPGDALHLDVWVVGPGCRPGNDQMLLFQRVARP